MSALLYNKKAEIKGKNVLITGGVKNLGAETAKELARFEANLFLHYHSNSDAEKAKAFAEELKGTGVKVGLFQGSLNKADEIAKLFDEANKFFGNGIDIAINNVGKVLKKPLTDITEEEWESMDTINNKSAFFFIKEAGKHVNENGKIVMLVTSLLAAYTPFYGAYQGTKSSVEWYSKAASKELSSKGISVNCVAPGPMDTPFLYGQETEESVAFFKTCGLHGRLTETADIVPIIRFLVTEGYWITGQTMFASGGFTAR